MVSRTNVMVLAQQVKSELSRRGEVGRLINKNYLGCLTSLLVRYSAHGYGDVLHQVDYPRNSFAKAGS